ncbi:biosynthetic-type acetolactate synthase large subunit [Candidatus Gracilibacteria bacterium]|nr:biosynthetic-type acetolactate synthase large subunit [Candidatus Gracilibacteria bacterium]
MKDKIQKTITGADLVLKILEKYGKVDTVFGYPGGASIPLYNAFARSGIRHILARHEQGAAFMAQGYSRSTGKIGVVDATSGPGVANTFTAVADAYKDSIPLLLISGQVPRAMIGKDAFQELETKPVFSGVTKYFTQIQDIAELESEVIKALDIAQSGRPGPVHIDIPKDILLVECSLQSEKTCKKIKKPEIQTEQISECLSMIEQAQKPILLIGHGVGIAQAGRELEEFLEKTKLPMVETALAKGIVPITHTQNFGMLGMHGFYEANLAVHHADLIINIGSRFDDRIVGKYQDFGKGAKIIHIDIDPRELGKVVQTDLKILADARDFLAKCNDRKIKASNNLQKWIQEIKSWKHKKPYTIPQDTFGGKQVLEKISLIGKSLQKEVIYGVDVGQHQMWSSQILETNGSENWLFSGGFGTMGFSLPACIGAAVANPDKKVVSISGDGGIQMNIQELCLLLQDERNTLKNLDIKIVILDNEYLGMVKQWQDLFAENERSQVDVLSPDFGKLADAYGVANYKLETLSDLNRLDDILSQDGPALIWCKIEKEENVFPMVPAGKRLDEMVFE